MVDLRPCYGSGTCDPEHHGVPIVNAILGQCIGSMNGIRKYRIIVDSDAICQPWYQGSVLKGTGTQV